MHLDLISRYAGFLVPCFAIAAAVHGAVDLQTKERSGVSDAEVAAIVAKAKSDPEILRELKDAPLEKAFRALNELWATGEGLSEQRANARRRGDEAEREWIEMQNRIGRDYETPERSFPIARDILLSHPDLEAFITSSLQHENSRLTDFYTKPGEPRNYEFVDPALGYPSLLFLLNKIPGDAAIRMAGSFLSSPYFPPRNHGDYAEVSPASAARGTLAGLVRARLQENIPEDIEAARQWWVENQHRFAAAPGSQSESPTRLPKTAERTSQSVSSPFPTAAAATADVAKHEINTWLLAGVAGLLVLLAAGLWFYRRGS
jgi:hypothetical protein